MFVVLSLLPPFFNLICTGDAFRYLPVEFIERPA